MLSGKYGTVDTRETPNEQVKKSKSFKSYALSIGLGLIAAYTIISILVIEISGRKGLKTPEEWKALMKDHPYQHKDTDLRSPCPMVNTLANHGFIARDGRSVKSDDLFNALMFLGAPPLFSVGLLKFVFSNYKEADPNGSFLSQFSGLESLDLDRLTLSGLLEHDVSLTRNDLRQAPYNTINPVPEYVHRMIQLAEFSNKGTKFEGIFTRKNENDARRLRWLESYKYNRYIHLNLFGQLASAIECSLLMDVIGRDGELNLPYLKSFLLNQTFPDGWYPRETTLSLKELVGKPIICYKGLHKSNVTLDLLDELNN